MKKLLLFICFFISIHAIGQHGWTEGTIYLKNGTVKEGLITFPRVSKDYITFNRKQRVRFKTHKKAKRERFDHTQIAKIIFDYDDKASTEYVYIPTTEKKYELFEKIVTGKATLYARSVNYTGNVGSDGATGMSGVCTWEDYNEFYILREGEEIASPLITFRISRSFRKRAMEYFSDCPAIVEKLEDKSYKKDDIKDVVESYNNCR